MPSWVPMCRCMQLYCESYFTAVDYWRKYESAHLLQNRVHMAESIAKLFHEYSKNKELFEFKLAFEHSGWEFMAAVIPSAGTEYFEGGDLKAFNCSRALVPEPIFNKSGLFFQNNVLKPLAGFNEALLAEANAENRKHLVTMVETLLRTPEVAGKVSIMFRQLPASAGEAEDILFHPYPQAPLTDAGRAFVAVLESAKTMHLPGSVEEAKKSYDKASTTKNGKEKSSKSKPKPEASKPKSKSKSKGAGSDPDDDSADGEWTEAHESVGTKVASHFPVPGSKNKTKLFAGCVTRFCPPTNARKNDQLYHVEWEDGDEQDFDEEEFQESKDLFVSNFGTLWVTDHASVGTELAAYFGTGKKRKLYTGKVAKFSPPSEDGDDHLYRVVWEDGDEEDYDEEEFQDAVELFNRSVHTASADEATASAKKRGRPKNVPRSEPEQKPEHGMADELQASELTVNENEGVADPLDAEDE